MIITLQLPNDTPLPTIGGVKELRNGRWQQIAGCRYARIRGSIEASYTYDQLALCVGVADYITAARLDNQFSL